MQEHNKNLKELEKAITLIQTSGEIGDLKLSEAKGLLEIITSYTKSFILLNQFDSNKLAVEKLNENITYEIQYSEALVAIKELKKQLIDQKVASEVFGNQKDESFKGILGNIVQSFGGE